MPVAEPFFNSRKIGSLLPFCVGRLDVSEFAYWTSLSGWSKENEPALEEQEKSISDSITKAIRLYYNLHSIEFSSSHSGNNLGVGPQSVEGMIYGNNIDYRSEDDAEETPTPPKDRVCPKGIVRKYGDDPQWGYQVEGSIYLGAVALYEGDIYNEENFRGYGAQLVRNLPINFSGLAHCASISFAKSGCSIGGCLESELSNPESIFKEEYAYVEWSEFHFVSLAYGLDDAWKGENSSYSSSLDAEAITADCNAIINGTNYTSSNSISNNLEFWTYP